MKTRWGQIRRRLLGLSPEETNFARRGFRGATPEMRARLERVAGTFVTGFHWRRAGSQMVLSCGLDPQLNTAYSQ